MRELQGKVAVVTGASKGIGAAIAKELAAAGAAVVVNYATSRDGAEKVVAEITRKEGRAIAVQADTSKRADVHRLFAETTKAFGRLDVLVNNAGVFNFQPLAEVTEAEFHRHYDTNVLGPILATQEAVKHFGPDGGSVINISSVAARNGTPNSVVYSGTKSALDTVSRILAKELGPRNIRVNSLSPGYTVTEGVVSAGIDASEMAKEMVAQTPLGRGGRPEDIAKVAVFLASERSAWITGEIVPVSGGLW
jgi:3-oxoacyl-[acyl-carrier protein] reductase